MESSSSTAPEMHVIDYTETALLFEPCALKIADQYDVSVNWYPDAAAPESSSVLDYSICRAPSLQPKFVDALELHPLGQTGDEKTGALRVALCGPMSESKVSCRRLNVGRMQCLKGSVRAPVAYDGALLQARMSVHEYPPATSVFKLCV